MKKILVMVILASLLLSGCSLFRTGDSNAPVSDADMATRVAELLATMTTPTMEEFFPPTPTLGLPTAQGLPSSVESSTPEGTAVTPVVVLTETTPAPTATATQEPTSEFTSTPEPPTATATATVTATANLTDPANRLGSPSSSDPMDSYQAWSWPTGSDSFLDVVFDGGYMKMTGLTKLAGWRLPLVSQQTNTYIELTANSGSCTGKDSYGIIFRVPVFKEPEQGYLYEVTCDGYYRLWKWDGKVPPSGQASILVNWKQSSAIHNGADQSNRLGVMVIDNKITLYMNGEKIGEASDSSYPAGFFGVFVLSRTSDKYTVKFDAMKFWENPKP
jgi:hypothetical protein